ncbi:MAG: hypothetical protein ACJ747_08080 [Gaiellaceae bacterium]|jgi:hypothetical protein
MSQKTKALLAAGVATVSVAVVPLTSLVVSGSAGAPVACSSGGGGGCAG